MKNLLYLAPALINSKWTESQRTAQKVQVMEMLLWMLICYSVCLSCFHVLCVVSQLLPLSLQSMVWHRRLLSSVKAVPTVYLITSTRQSLAMVSHWLTLNKIMVLFQFYSDFHMFADYQEAVCHLSPLLLGLWCLYEEELQVVMV